jgi:hypothetical protein
MDHIIYLKAWHCSKTPQKIVDKVVASDKTRIPLQTASLCDACCIFVTFNVELLAIDSLFPSKAITFHHSSLNGFCLCSALHI